MTMTKVLEYDHGSGTETTKLIPANTKHLYNIYAMLAQRRRRWVDVV